MSQPVVKLHRDIGIGEKQRMEEMEEEEEKEGEGIVGEKMYGGGDGCCLYGE